MRNSSSNNQICIALNTLLAEGKDSTRNYKDFLFEMNTLFSKAIVEYNYTKEYVEDMIYRLNELHVFFNEIEKAQVNASAQPQHSPTPPQEEKVMHVA